MERRLQQCLLPDPPSCHPAAAAGASSASGDAAAGTAALFVADVPASAAGSATASDGHVQQALKLSKLLGRGTFGSVYLGSWCVTRSVPSLIAGL
jgi:hypothetical protein